ncbi:MAG: GNAT family N-acetyltransferase [Paludibacteraceae bacterium]
MLRLRKLEPTDLPFLYQWENDARAWSDSDTHNPLSQHDLREYIESSSGDIYRDGQLRLMIEDDGETLGCIDLFDFDARNRKAAIGMYIAESARGKGVGKRAVQLVEDYAFQHLHLRLLYAIIATDNAPCTAVYRSLNYINVALLPNWTLESNAALWLKLETEKS